MHRLIPVLMITCLNLFSQPAKFISIPNATWEPICFKSINLACNQAGLDPLRTQSLSVEKEIRIWVGFGLTGIYAYIIRNSNGTWSAYKLDMNPYDQGGQYILKRIRKRNNYQQLWQYLSDNGFMNFQDCSTFPHKSVLDGVCYVVEVLEHESYRTFMIDNPEFRPTAQDKTFLRIMGRIAKQLK